MTAATLTFQKYSTTIHFGDILYATLIRRANWNHKWIHPMRRSLTNIDKDILVIFYLLVLFELHKPECLATLHMYRSTPHRPPWCRFRRHLSRGKASLESFQYLYLPIFYFQPSTFFLIAIDPTTETLKNFVIQIFHRTQKEDLPYFFSSKYLFISSLGDICGFVVGFFFFF